MLFASDSLPLKPLISNKNRLSKKMPSLSYSNKRICRSSHKMKSVSFPSDNDSILVITAITANSVSELQLTAVFAAREIRGG